MSFALEREAFLEEFSAYYRAYPVDVSEIMEGLAAKDIAQPSASSFRRKSWIYQAAAEQCEIHVFRYCPFFYEIRSGRKQNTWGMDGIGTWLLQRNQCLNQQFQDWHKEYGDQGIFLANSFVDIDHQCIGYDRLLALGLKGIIKEARQRLAAGTTPRQQEFLASVIVASESLITLSTRLARKAAAMLDTETDQSVQQRLQRIVDTAGRIPAEPPATFYEALNAIWFLREASSSLEGIGVSILGHLDRMLYPFYQADLEAGRLTREEAKDLVFWFLSLTDARWDYRASSETSTTVVIGGCDREGHLVYNDVTQLIIEAFRELNLISPKLNARISQEHPQEYFNLLADLSAQGTNVLALFNDDVLIPANVQQGKTLADSRLYVAGGCQEPMLQNTESNCRAFVYLNLVQVLWMTLAPERWSFWQREQLLDESKATDSPDTAGSLDSCGGFNSLASPSGPRGLNRFDDFERFYAAYLHNLDIVIRIIAQKCYQYEKQWGDYNPCPLHSATIENCVAQAKDMTEGGARYNSSSFSLVGLGTLVDSLSAIKTVVYDTKRWTLQELQDMLEADFQHHAYEHQFLLHRVPKFGRGDKPAVLLTQKVAADLARLAGGHANARGGTHEASLFAYYNFANLGRKTAATPDGRGNGQTLSRGMGPSDLGLGPDTSIGDILDAMRHLDLKAYPGGGVLDITLPLSLGTPNNQAIAAVIRGFLQQGGSILQMNIASEEALREAQLHPERNPGLTVRVCGYSAPFTLLAKDIQSEIIHRVMLSR